MGRTLGEGGGGAITTVEGTVRRGALGREIMGKGTVL